MRELKQETILKIVNRLSSQEKFLILSLLLTGVGMVVVGGLMVLSAI